MKFKTVVKLLIMPVVGILLMGLPFVFLIRDLQTPDIASIEAPGSGLFEIEEESTVVVWREVAGVTSHDEFRVLDKELPAGLSIVLKKADSDTTVALRESMGTSVSSGGSSTKVSLVKADLKPGKYELIAKTDGDVMDLVVSPEKLKLTSFLIVLVFNLAGGLIFLAGVIYALVVVIKHFTRKPTPAQT